jgi:hypothetical protein
MYPTVQVKESGGRVWLDKSFPVTDEQLARGFEKCEGWLPDDDRYSNAVLYNDKYYVPRYVLKCAIEEEVKRRFHLEYDDFKIENTQKVFKAFKNRGWDIEFITNFDWPIIRTSRGLSIAGTRITLYTIMDYIKADWPPKLIQNWLNLTDKQINDVMDYIKTHSKEVEVEYQTILKEAEETERYWREYNQEHLARVAAMPPKPGQEAIRAKLQERKAKWELHP